MKDGIMEAADYRRTGNHAESHREMDEKWAEQKPGFVGDKNKMMAYIFSGGRPEIFLPIAEPQLERIDHYSRLKIGAIIHKLGDDGKQGFTYARWKLVGLHNGAQGCENFAELESITWKKGSAHGKTVHNIFVPLEFIIGNPKLGLELPEEPVVDWELRKLEVERHLLDVKIAVRKGYARGGLV